MYSLSIHAFYINKVVGKAFPHADIKHLIEERIMLYHFQLNKHIHTKNNQEIRIHRKSFLTIFLTEPKQKEMVYIITNYSFCFSKNLSIYVGSNTSKYFQMEDTLYNIYKLVQICSMDVGIGT